MADVRLLPPAEPRTAPISGGVPAGPRVAGRLHALVLRIDAATPAGRDRAIDVLRALSTLGVVLGHWLVTAVTLRADGHLMNESPLGHLPALTPLSWVLQPLAIFFFVGGRVAARSYPTGHYRPWLAKRMRRLLRPVGTLLSLWILVVLGLAAAGVAHETISTLFNLVLSPLWFLLVFLVLTALTPLVRRAPGRIAVVACAVVAVLDAAHFAGGGADWIETVRNVNVLAGWLVPYCLGAVWAAGGFARRRPAALLLGGGVAATAALIVWGGYPASMVGVNGAAMSNLNPLSLAAVTFGLAQCGAALLLCGPLRRLVGQPRSAVRPAQDRQLRGTPGQFAWAAVALMNTSVITVFLWHQTAMISVTALALGLDGPLFGLHTAPDTLAWVPVRLLWMAVFALLLVGLCRAFGRVEHDARSGRATVA
ncbi:acyltransferase family protein [Streptomyces natalensis]|uniref:Acyltransferase n=1 Tax=Streptomyces natalensis ATCC 27448 TaxID=1240678 RepID=A0A0D7CN05_9ACTN|nr:acyltransferase [Streptomyces natalensis]KIZ17629.1 acyltransferase [Streptomyces natalensis ATCC 27448]